VIQLDGVHKSYIHLLEDESSAVVDLSMHVRQGEVCGLIGPNGAGKSTTIKMILGLTRPTQGKVSEVDKCKVGYVPENPYFYTHLTGHELLDLYARIFKIKNRKELITKLLHKVNLEDAKNNRLSTYSKGMLQRIGIAQALINNPSLLILDEPMSGLDPIGRHQIKQIIEEEKAKGTTVIICSHILADIQDLCTQIIMLSKGRVVIQGATEEVCAGRSLEEVFMEKIGDNNQS